MGAIAVALLAANLVVLLWAEHEFTPAESIVALHSNMLASGDGIYYDLNRYPYTVSLYGLAVRAGVLRGVRAAAPRRPATVAGRALDLLCGVAGDSVVDVARAGFAGWSGTRGGWASCWLG
jgi:hypothetical protein